MFTDINFKSYVETRKRFYDQLEMFEIVKNNISEPITLDQNFFNRLNENLGQYIARRSENTKKFSKAENEEYKRLLKLHFPETLPIFDNWLPTIYWFKINYSEGVDNKKILTSYIKLKKANKKKGWWTQASWARAENQTQFLYVGKMEKGFQNRFIQHIGLGHSFTSSLKLQSWINTVPGLSLDFQFLQLDLNMLPHLEDVENVVWRHLNPLLGAAPRIK